MGLWWRYRMRFTRCSYRKLNFQCSSVNERARALESDQLGFKFSATTREASDHSRGSVIWSLWWGSYLCWATTRGLWCDHEPEYERTLGGKVHLNALPNCKPLRDKLKNSAGVLKNVRNFFQGSKCSKVFFFILKSYSCLSPKTSKLLKSKD